MYIYSGAKFLNFQCTRYFVTSYHIDRRLHNDVHLTPESLIFSPYILLSNISYKISSLIFLFPGDCATQNRTRSHIIIQPPAHAIFVTSRYIVAYNIRKRTQWDYNRIGPLIVIRYVLLICREFARLCFVIMILLALEIHVIFKTAKALGSWSVRHV